MHDILNLKRNLNPIIGSKVTAIFRLFVKLHPNGSANGGATPSRNRSDFSLRVTVRVKRFDSPGHLDRVHLVLMLIYLFTSFMMKIATDCNLVPVMIST